MKKQCVANILRVVWDTFLYEIKCNDNAHKANYKFGSISVFPFCKNKNQESNFQQGVGLVTKNISAFCLQWITFYFKGMLNLIDFNEEMFFLQFHALFKVFSKQN